MADLTITLDILAANGQIPIMALHEVECLGRRALVVPKENAKEACMASGLTVFAVEHLLELVGHFNAQEPLSPYRANGLILQSRPYPDLSEVQGQIAAKRALLVAAAGAA